MTRYDEEFNPIGATAIYPMDEPGEFTVPASEENVTMVTVTYIQDVGINMRAVIIPGATHQAAITDMLMMGGKLCTCNPPTMWNITAVSRESQVCTVTTMDSHLAAMLIQYPDLVFEEDALDGWYHSASGTIHQQLRMVPPSSPLRMVCAESFSHLEDAGVYDNGGLGYDEVVSVDIEDLVTKFFEEN